MRLSWENRNDILKLAGALAPCFLMTTGDNKKSRKGILPKIFDKNPELKEKALDYLARVPREKKEEDFKKFEKFVKGEITWAEIKGYPKSMLKELARMAYLKYQTGDFRLAESLFKGLSIIDHVNWYYRSALGAVYQKQKLYEQAIEEYTMALSLNDKEIASLTNRGECYLHLENYQSALNDLTAAIALDHEGKNSWGKRARVLQKKIIDEGHGNPLMEE